MSGHAFRPRRTTTTSDTSRAMREQLQKKEGAGSSLRSSSLSALSRVALTIGSNRASSAGPSPRRRRHRRCIPLRRMKPCPRRILTCQSLARPSGRRRMASTSPCDLLFTEYGESRALRCLIGR
jgi:hypothetical protein